MLPPRQAGAAEQLPYAVPGIIPVRRKRRLGLQQRRAAHRFERRPRLKNHFLPELPPVASLVADFDLERGLTAAQLDAQVVAAIDDPIGINARFRRESRARPILPGQRPPGWRTIRPRDAVFPHRLVRGANLPQGHAARAGVSVTCSRARTYEPTTMKAASACAARVSTVGNTANQSPIHDGIARCRKAMGVVGSQLASCISCACSPTMTSSTRPSMTPVNTSI